MSLGSKSSLHHMQNYLDLIKNTLSFKEFLETEGQLKIIHTFEVRIRTVIDHLGNLTLDCVGIPAHKIYLRNLYIDLIIEHFVYKSISRKHLEQMLINWKDDDIMKQAE